MSALDGGRTRATPSRAPRPEPRKARPTRDAGGDGAGNQNWLRRFAHTRTEPAQPARPPKTPQAAPHARRADAQTSPEPPVEHASSPDAQSEAALQLEQAGAARGPVAAAAPPPSPGDSTPPANGRAHGPLRIEERIVADAGQAGPGQMRRIEFLEALQAEVTVAAEEELARDGRSIGDCPWIPYWFAFYRRRDAGHITRALVRYAPEAASATSLGEAIGAVTRRVRDSVRRSLEAGRPIGVPAGVPAHVFDPRAAQRPPSGEAALDPILNEPPRDGAHDGPPDETSPLQGLLGAGRPLEAGTRARMEAAFRTDFGGVRLHTGAEAQTAAGRLHARAFAYGSDVAFAPGQHRPGTTVGDALLAHELAHVLQQRPSIGDDDRRAAGDAAPLAGRVGHDQLESDADRVAGSALVAIAGRGAGPIAPRQTSMLAMARCGEEDDLTVEKTVKVKTLRMFDSTRNPDPDIAFWNTHERPQANMRMHKAGDELITEDRVDPLIGHDHKLEQSSCGLSDEESRLRSEFGSSSVLPAVYVKEIVDIPSKPFIGKHIPEACGSRAVVVVEDAAIRQTLSHEAGHAMGLGHQETPRNLMRSAPLATDTKLEDDQIRTIRSSSFAQ